MKLGISSYSYTWAVGVPGSIPPVPLSAKQLIDKASALKVNLVQFADNLPLETQSEELLKELYSYASGKEISLEMGGRGLLPEHTLECLKAAEILKSPILRMVIDQQGFEPSVSEIITIIKSILPEFRKRNIKLAIENHDRLKAVEFEEIIQKSGNDFVGICLDSVNSMGAGEGFESVSDILLPYTFNLHLKDFSIRRVSHKMGFVIEGTPAGKGMLNIPLLLQKLDEFGKCQSAVLELWTPFQENLEETINLEERWASESIAFLKPVFVSKNILMKEV